MDTAPAAAQFDRMFEVQHFVIDDVFDGIAGYGEVIENPADDDRVVRGIVMAQNAAGPGRAPTHARPRQQAMKETCIQVFEYCIEIVEQTARRTQLFASPHLAQQVRLLHDFMAAHIFAIASRVTAVDWLAIHLRQQNVSDCPQDRLGGSFQQIGKPDQELAFA